MLFRLLCSLQRRSLHVDVLHLVQSSLLQVIEPRREVIIYRVCAATAASSVAADSLRNASFGLGRVAQCGRCLAKL